MDIAFELPEEDIAVDGSKRRDRQQKAAWSETKTAVHDYAKNPCAATEQAVSEALGKVRDLSGRLPEPQKKAGKTQRGE